MPSILLPVLAVLLVQSCVTSPPQIRHDAVSAISAPLSFPVVILTWNIGYAGLGSYADFISDGGRSIISSTRTQVQQNIDGISALLRMQSFDIAIIQEAALPSAATHLLSPFEAIATALEPMWAAYSSKFVIRFPVAATDVGEALFSRTSPESVSRFELSTGPAGTLIVRERYHLLVSRFPVAGSDHYLVVANVHLPAFDKRADLRRKHLAEVAGFLASEYEKGNYVVCGGDWNLRLVPTAFSYTTEEKDLFWVADMPTTFPPPGWSIVADPHVPSVRTLERAYVPGQNYTAVIDGFVVSPNLRVVNVTGIDAGFRYSDHNPVTTTVEPNE